LERTKYGGVQSCLLTALDRADQDAWVGVALARTVGCRRCGGDPHVPHAPKPWPHPAVGDS
jgi:hypothetical protein